MMHLAELWVLPEPLCGIVRNIIEQCKWLKNLYWTWGVYKITKNALKNLLFSFLRVQLHIRSNFQVSASQRLNKKACYKNNLTIIYLMQLKYQSLISWTHIYKAAHPVIHPDKVLLETP